MSDQSDEFLNALAGAHLQEDERLILCGFPGDPNTAGVHAWKPKPWRPGREIVINDRDNGYVTVGAFKRAGDGSFRRRTDCFSAGLAFMIDDIGTKITHEMMAGAPAPSAIVETSEGNFQWWYFLHPERDVSVFDNLIYTFIKDKLKGLPDPGMAGVTRVGRIPGFRNCKPTANNWLVTARELTPGLRYKTNVLMDKFGLKPGSRKVFNASKLRSEQAEVNVANFRIAVNWLNTNHFLKNKNKDASGWREIQCPWIDNHTNRADNGAAIREPAPENDYYGAFRCHHGGCIDKGWSELTDYIADNSERSSNEANDRDSGDLPEWMPK